MPFRIEIVAGAIVALCGLGGCAGGAAGSAPPSFMQTCQSKATTDQERNECAWSNASRMASGR